MPREEGGRARKVRNQMYPSGNCIFQALRISVESLKTAAEAALLNFIGDSHSHQFQKHLDEETVGVGSICYMQTSQSIQSLGLSLKLLYPNADTLYFK